MTGCGAKIRSTFWFADWNLFWQMLDGNLHGSGTLHATTACPKQPLGHFGGWAMPWLAEEVLDGQHQSVAIPAQPELLTTASSSRDLNRLSPVVSP